MMDLIDDNDEQFSKCEIGIGSTSGMNHTFCVRKNMFFRREQFRLFVSPTSNDRSLLSTLFKRRTPKIIFDKRRTDT